MVGRCIFLGSPPTSDPSPSVRWPSVGKSSSLPGVVPHGGPVAGQGKPPVLGVQHFWPNPPMNQSVQGNGITLRRNGFFIGIVKNVSSSLILKKWLAKSRTMILLFFYFSLFFSIIALHFAFRAMCSHSSLDADTIPDKKLTCLVVSCCQESLAWLLEETRHWFWGPELYSSTQFTNSDNT